MLPPQDRLRIIPLGGLGEIGMNCLALDNDEDIVLVDCGTRFSNDDCGVDVIHPDFRWLRQNRARLRGLFLTHGHEDHIGAVPYLIQDLNIPIYGPRHALRLTALRLEQHGFDPHDVVMREVKVGERVAIDSFSFEPIRVSHSIADATALAIRTQAGLVLHTGDFKFDPKPSDGEVTDERRLAELGEEGVALLLSDSTNVDEVGEAGSESDVAEQLLLQVEQAKQRVFVALFASNIQRLISLGRIAERTGRRICALGTSLRRHIEIAQDLGMLHWPKSLLLPAENARTFPRSELMVLASGTQAEPGSAMWRLAQRDHRFVDIEPNDSVIFSSRIIPGHERIVVAMICDLLRLGAKVEWGRRSRVHTSGHACRAEQEKMIQLLNPRSFVPVHGTLHHLKKHAELASAAGVEQVDVIENGQTVVLEGGRLRRGASVEAGDVHVGLGREVLGPEVLRRRKDLARGGQLTVACVCDRRGRLLQAPNVNSQGVAFFDEAESYSRELATALQTRWPALAARNNTSLSDDVRRFTCQWLEAQYRLRPLVSVMISTLEKRALA
jgi:ribonuclease J